MYTLSPLSALAPSPEYVAMLYWTHSPIHLLPFLTCSVPRRLSVDCNAWALLPFFPIEYRQNRGDRCPFSSTLSIPHYGGPWLPLSQIQLLLSPVLAWLWKLFPFLTPSAPREVIASCCDYFWVTHIPCWSFKNSAHTSVNSHFTEIFFF